METQLVHAIINAELGIRVEVKTHNKGYLVAVFDTDAEKYFPSMIIVPKLETALEKAIKAAA
jgi:hypothetical protein